MTQPSGLRSNVPHSIEAEQSVIGALLNDNGAFERVDHLLAAADFHDPGHRAIYATVRGMMLACKPVDVITVFEAGGHDLAYLNAMAASVPGSANVHQYAAIVRERALERAMIERAGQVVELAQAPGELADKLDRALSLFAGLGQQATRRDPVTIEDALPALMDHINALHEGGERVVETGLRRLDRLTAGGIRPGDLWVIGGRPSMGKTAFTLTMARNMAQRSGTLFLSQEMPVGQLAMRHAAAVGRINLAHLRKPSDAPDAMWEGLVRAVEELRPLRLSMDDQAGLSLHDVRRKVIATRRKAGLDIVFVDYLQLMQGEGENRNLELDRIVNGLKAMALEFEMGVVLLSQLKRTADERSGPPVMSDLRDSGAIEAAADLIGMLYRDYVRNPTESNKNHAQLEIVKQRAGPAGSVHLWFDGAHQRFEDWPDGEPLPKRGDRRRGGGIDAGME